MRRLYHERATTEGGENFKKTPFLRAQKGVVADGGRRFLYFARKEAIGGPVGGGEKTRKVPSIDVFGQKGGKRGQRKDLRSGGKEEERFHRRIRDRIFMFH